MKAVVIVIGALLVSGATLVYFGGSAGRQERRDYDESRLRWHQECDAYVGKPTTSEDAKDCAKRLEAMMAYANGQGW